MKAERRIHQFFWLDGWRLGLRDRCVGVLRENRLDHSQLGTGYMIYKGNRCLGSGRVVIGQGKRMGPAVGRRDIPRTGGGKPSLLSETCKIPLKKNGAIVLLTRIAAHASITPEVYKQGREEAVCGGES